MAVSSLVSGGCIVSGASLNRTLLFTGVRVNSFSAIENSVILPYVNVARGARLKNVVVDRGVNIPEGLVVARIRSLMPRASAARQGHLPDHPGHDRPDRLMPSGLDVLSVASEVYPLVKTGGLADVVGALPRRWRLRISAQDPRAGYPTVMAKLESAAPVYQFNELFGGPARLLDARGGGLDLFVLDAPHLYDRPGGPYAGPDGADFSDNAFRFAALGKAAQMIANGIVEGQTPRILHLHDWQRACGGLCEVFLRLEAWHHHHGSQSCLSRPGAGLSARHARLAAGGLCGGWR